MNRKQVLHEASQVVFEHLGRLLGGRSYFLAENDLTTNWIVSAWNRNEPLVKTGAALSYEHTYCKIVYDREGPAWIPDTSADPSTMHLEATERLGPCSFIGVPVYRSGGRRYGTICAIDRPHGFDDTALAQLEQAAVFIGVLLDVENSFYIDELTELYNRTYLEMFYDHLSAEANVGAVFIDIDRCKTINETYGRPFGDELLRQFAERLRNAVRGAGIPARYAGDEFMAIFFHRTKEQLEAAAASIYRKLTEPFLVMGREVSVTVSMGVSAEGGSLRDHILQSDAAMYQIKKNGKQGIAVYDDRLHPLIPENGVRRSVKFNSFQIVYQPIVEVATGESAVEALVRIRHPEMGIVGPNMFLPAAKQSGYLLQMDLHTIRTACLQVQELPDWRNRIAKLAVNCDALELRQPDFPEMVDAILRETNFPADRLEFELNERISLFDVEAIEPQVMRMREQGISFALDDFGHGSSTLGLLLKLPVEKVKLDRLFVEQIDRDPRSRTIVEHLLAMCERLGLAVVAEGIETDAQLRTLRELGCRWMQGYRLGRPVPFEQLHDTLLAAAAP
ncbi:bifunctional diguanylate cyclase/phosphodiesterase [Paenibacillus sp.]|uniref:bifunctional diguanylate cyclase/phosphodiesterase n=1 Tax=Paenibacillus sp. TaxID=58172 RepID=UPI002D64C4F7|nr:bifunctional diguanylate cyclase/phosphodiesterase [Paenibacillus sp.]HZG87677.1 bifunctional diguanylate cyclase/phosphodiesterase [Paenibacillus sp.]